MATIYATGDFDPERTDYKEKDVLVLSKGHAAPALYSTWCAEGYFSFKDFIQELRKPFSIYQGHPSSIKKTQGLVPASTGSLGQGSGIAEGIAIGKNLNSDSGWVYLLLSDGEIREGSTQEAINLANKYPAKLDNIIAFLDTNKLEIDGRPQNMMPLDVKGMFERANWKVYECDLTREDRYQQIYQQLKKAKNVRGKPKVIICETIKGQGVSFMEDKREFHGRIPTSKELNQALEELGEPDIDLLKKYGYDEKEYKRYKWRKKGWKKVKRKKINKGKRKIYPVGESHKIRKVFGKTLQELMHLNKEIIVLANGLANSGGLASYNKKNPLIAEDPSLEDRYFNMSLTEQNTVSFAGGLAAYGYLSYYYTFAKFYERSKDQLDMNIKSGLSVKYIVSHIGLDTGQDGESHQQLDYLNLFSKARCPHIILADANQGDVVARWSLTYPGPVVIMMGRSAIPIIAKENGEPFFDEEYSFDPSKADVIRKGDDATVISYGPVLHKALQARDTLKEKYGNEVRVINFSTPSLGLHDKFIDWGKVVKAAKETGAILVAEDHRKDGSLGQKIACKLFEEKIFPEFKHLAIPNYFKGTSGTPEELYSLADVGLSEGKIRAEIGKLLAQKK